jgi:hypothetical protein
LFQDEVAAGFVVRMLGDPTCTEVQCETADDCTRVLQRDADTTLELVQAKSGEPGHLWTVASITSPAGSSIVDGFLERDNFKESAQFRAVTVRQVHPELSPLRLPRGSAVRLAAASDESQLADAIGARVSRISMNKVDGRGWVALTEWDERSLGAVHNENVLLLDRFLLGEGLTLLPDQVEAVYGAVVEEVIAAAQSPDYEQKRMKRVQLIEFVRDSAANAIARDGGESRLQTKMRRAHIDEVEIETAIFLRTEYLNRVRSRGYESADDASRASREVSVELMALRLARTIEDGPAFHRLCFDRITSISADNVDRRAHLLGAMYDVTSRCMHRFEPSP